MSRAADQVSLCPIPAAGAALLPLPCSHSAVVIESSCNILSPAAPGADRRQTALNQLVPATCSPPPDLMNSTSLTLGTVLLAVSGLFCLATLFFGTKGGYYDTDAYDGNGTAH